MCVVHINAYLVVWIAIQFVVLGTQLICMVLLYTWSACFPMKLNAMHTWYSTRVTLINLITVWLVLISLQPQHSKEMLMHECTLQLSFTRELNPCLPASTPIPTAAWWDGHAASSCSFVLLRSVIASLWEAYSAHSHLTGPVSLQLNWQSARTGSLSNLNCSYFQSTGTCLY